MNSMYLRYNICMILVVLTVFPNLYWAVRAPWKPRDPEKPKPPRGRISANYLLRAALACLLLGILTWVWV